MLAAPCLTLLTQVQQPLHRASGGGGQSAFLSSSMLSTGKPHRRCEEQAPQRAAQRPQRRLSQHDGHAVRCVCAQDTGTRPCSPCAQSVPHGGHPELPQTGQLVQCRVYQLLAEAERLTKAPDVGPLGKNQPACWFVLAGVVR